jgi:hypothetical protein
MITRSMSVAVTGLVLLLSPTIAFAGENPLLGTWKLKSFVREVAATGEKTTKWANTRMAISATPQMAACMRLEHRTVA